MMKKSKWKRRYIDRLKSVAGVTEKWAIDYYKAGMEVHEFDQDPEDQADTELSYWNE